MMLSDKIDRTIIDEICAEDFSECFGLRQQEEPFELGSLDHLSHIWVDGDDTGEELDGICATCIDYDLIKRTHLFADHVALIGGTRIASGEDEGEIILANAKVLYVFC
ncbi:MAG: hypothetical protein IJ719_08225 [Clostridia bacterium]|nr:hypothetical protein [Clostridia bacterium]